MKMTISALTVICIGLVAYIMIFEAGNRIIDSSEAPTPENLARISCDKMVGCYPALKKNYDKCIQASMINGQETITKRGYGFTKRDLDELKELTGTDCHLYTTLMHYITGIDLAESAAKVASETTAN